MVKGNERRAKIIQPRAELLVVFSHWTGISSMM
jgi:hypothetical protein